MTLYEQIAEACSKKAEALKRAGDSGMSDAIYLLGLAADALRKASPEQQAIWEYHNDEHGTWWGCSNCGKIIHRPPTGKLYCSRCGAKMSMEK